MNDVEILIIEDSNTFAEYIAAVVQKEKYKTTIAGTGSKGKYWLDNKQFNLVLLDMELPDCSGIDIIRHIRETFDQTELPVIFLSATTDETKIIEALNYGANDFISKPFSEITLLIKLRNLLQLQKSSMQLNLNLKIQEEQNNQLQILAKQLAQTNKDKDLFISILAHDLKNPFNALLGFSDLLVRNLRAYPMDKIEFQLGIINKTSHQTYHLLEDLLLWSKSQAGALPFHPEKIRLEDLVESQINDLSLMADTKSILITANIPKNTVLVADVNMIKTVFRNVLTNALKFTHKNGKIHITSQENGKYAQITISDNGVGIAKEVIPKLFDSSKPYTTEGTEQETGTGLGLLLCQDFIEKHGGKIWVESEKGKGSDFKFTVPLHMKTS